MKTIFLRILVVLSLTQYREVAAICLNEKGAPVAQLATESASMMSAMSTAQANSVAPAITRSITLAWNAPQDPSVVGYAVYYKQNASPLMNRVSIGKTTSAKLDNLIPSATYEIYTVSIGAAGIESIPSNTISYTVPSLGSKLSLVGRDAFYDLTLKTDFPNSLQIVQSSKDLKTWKNIGQVLTDANGAGLYRVQKNPKIAQEFFRLSTAASDFAQLPKGPTLAIRTKGEQGISKVPKISLAKNNADISLSMTGGMPNINYMIQRTSDLSHWSNLAPLMALENGANEYKTTVSTASDRQFYRLAYPNLEVVMTSAIAGKKYELETSHDLKTWKVLDQATAGPEGSFIFQTRSGSDRDFYRVKAQ